MTETTGLTLGKYAPLHRGHQHVIETALSECSHVIVLIYDCPETTPVPLTIRARWIRDLYPSVEVIELWDGPTEMGNTPEITKMHDDYLLCVLRGRTIFRFYSSEFYGDHVSRAFGALNRQVDPDRNRFPVSGTRLRENPYEYREYIHPRVYCDLIANIAFLGAPSTGKTTLCKTLADEYSTAWMPEYGREYWEKHQTERRLSLEQLVEIAEGHIERENQKLLESNRYLFTDTNAVTTYLFSQYYHKTAHPLLTEYAKKAQSRYDLIFVCGTAIPYEDSWDRSGNAMRENFQKQILGDLHERKQPFFTVDGSLEERVRFVKSVLQGFHKYQNLFDWIKA